MPEYIDIHCHPNFPQYNEDREDLLARMLYENVYGICVGTDMKTSQESVSLSKINEHLYSTVGIHPTENITSIDRLSFLELAKDKKVVAVGECGLDYYRRSADQAEKLRQREIFRQQIEIALELALPLMIHCRPSLGSMDAYEEVVNILSEYKDRGVRGNVHFFVGNIDIAKKFLELGFTMSFTGVITFARDYDDVISFLPLERIMVETDSPFVAPLPFRGKRNEPTYVKEVVSKIAEIKNVGREEVRNTILETTKMVFGIAES